MTMTKSGEFMVRTAAICKLICMNCDIVPDVDCCKFWLPAFPDKSMKLPMYVLEKANEISFDMLNKAVRGVKQQIEDRVRIGAPVADPLEYAIAINAGPPRDDAPEPVMQRFIRSKVDYRFDQRVIAGVTDSLDKVSEILGIVSKYPCLYTVTRILTRKLDSNDKWTEVPDILRP